MDANPMNSESSSCLSLIERAEQILTQHREENPDLYRLVDLKREQDTPSSPGPTTASIIENADILCLKAANS